MKYLYAFILFLPSIANAVTINYVATSESRAYAIHYRSFPVVDGEIERGQEWLMGDGAITATLDNDTGELHVFGSLNDPQMPPQEQGPDWFYQPLQVQIEKTNNPYVPGDGDFSTIREFEITHLGQLMPEFQSNRLVRIGGNLEVTTLGHWRVEGATRDIELLHTIYLTPVTAAAQSSAVPEPAGVLLLPAAIVLMFLKRKGAALAAVGTVIPAIRRRC